jgi:hypothetical protein
MTLTDRQQCEVGSVSVAIWCIEFSFQCNETSNGEVKLC